MPPPNVNSERNQGTTDERLIQAYVQNTIPLNVHDLPSHLQTCPICQEPYAIRNAAFQHPLYSGRYEYPVRVHGRHPNSTCRHVFGRRCIEEYFRSQTPWSTKCPICREEWFPTYEEINAALSGQRNTANVAVRRQDQAQSVRLTLPRTPSRNTLSLTILEAPEVFVHEAPQVVDVAIDTSDGGVTLASGLSNLGRIHRSIGFLERILAAFDVDDQDTETSNAVAAMEAITEELWQRLEARRRERAEANGTSGSSRS
ncbi:hypothetical protein EJ04DRAFT_138013 [Polyplosphaeria fusca]|uniref:RING-type domain-containing protein n=1 Tax=Polyplosphaeria fusca TaxID=682080 RepID=A0A9P4QM86_9PLEO|nr:hypothetical protein EJ04DRAFT_138013 [Polyplosphaeria fusca]